MRCSTLSLIELRTVRKTTGMRRVRKSLRISASTWSPVVVPSMRSSRMMSGRHSTAASCAARPSSTAMVSKPALQHAFEQLHDLRFVVDDEHDLVVAAPGPAVHDAGDLDGHGFRGWTGML